MILGGRFEVHLADVNRPVEIHDGLDLNRLVGWRFVAQLRITKGYARHYGSVTSGRIAPEGDHVRIDAVSGRIPSLEANRCLRILELRRKWRDRRGPIFDHSDDISLAGEPRQLRDFVPPGLA
jgi:hypothetical protein